MMMYKSKQRKYSLLIAFICGSCFIAGLLPEAPAASETFIAGEKTAVNEEEIDEECMVSDGHCQEDEEGSFPVEDTEDIEETVCLLVDAEEIEEVLMPDSGAGEEELFVQFIPEDGQTSEELQTSEEEQISEERQIYEEASADLISEDAAAENEDTTVVSFSLEDPFSARHRILSTGKLTWAGRYASGIYDAGFSYGRQLSGNAGGLYQQWIDFYVTHQNTGNLQIRCQPEETAYRYEADIAGGEPDLSSEAYLGMAHELRKDMQAALDAFTYDCPQVFWTRKGDYRIQIKTEEDPASSTGYSGIVSDLIYMPEEIFPGASSYMNVFQSRIRQTAGELDSTIAYCGGGTDNRSMYEYLKAAHDYICDHAWYDYNALNTYISSGDYRIFSPAGIFLDEIGGGVVCEGYARAMKILCDLEGIPCVCIGGYAGGESHMWNGVLLDGNWYLIDAAWDDTARDGNPSLTEKEAYAYFLTGCSYALRIPTGDLSESKLTYFKYPFLMTTAYNRETEENIPAQTETEPETETETGIGPEPETEMETEADTGEETETDTGAEPETETETNTDPKPEGETETDTDPDSGLETETEKDTDPIPETEKETGSHPTAETECCIGLKSETERNTVTEPQTGSVTCFKPETERKQETEADTKSETELEASRYVRSFPRTIRIRSVKRKGRRAIVRWNKIRHIAGYQIQYSSRRNFKHAKTINIRKSSKTRYMIRKLNRHRPLYVRIRCWRKKGRRRVYSFWSSSVKGKFS